jgi:hypothetical protein
MPLIAFVLLALTCLALFGFVCACLADNPIQALDRAVSAGQALPAVIEVWTLAFVTSLAASVLLVGRTGVASRASPALLQRFLF